jgi:hypothetical protein
MKEEFVPYELAFKLIYELGFKEKCLATIDQSGYLHIKGTKSSPRGSMLYDIVDCPTFSQAFRWFREIHALDGFFDRIGTTYIYKIRSWKNESTNSFSTYEEAELACLEKLIEIVELNNKNNDKYTRITNG